MIPDPSLSINEGAITVMGWQSCADKNSFTNAILVALCKEYDFDFDGYDVEISIVAENPRHIFFPRNLFEAISAKSNY